MPARQVGEALCRPRAALGSNYSQRPISTPFPRAPRGSAVGSYILHGRKLDKCASASWPIGRRLPRVAFSDRWYAPFDDGRILRPSCVSWTEKEYRRAGSAITVSQLRSTIRPCFSSELCIIVTDLTAKRRESPPSFTTHTY